MNTAKVWFITGVSTGFGRSMTEYALRRGDVAVATLRTPSVMDTLRAQWPEDKLIVLKLDVTKRGDISHALEYVKAKVGRIDFVFNNAGYGLMAEVEGTPEDAAKAMFDVNFWGAAYIAREAIEFFRDVNKPRGGTLLNVSSYMGLVPQPLMGYYVASKHALEGVTEVFARELDPAWNIRVSLLEFGGFHTAATSSMVVLPAHPSYTDPALPSVVMRKLSSDWEAQGDPDKAAGFIYGFVNCADRLPIRLAIGLDAITMIKEKVKVLHDDLAHAERIHKDVVLTRSEKVV